MKTRTRWSGGDLAVTDRAVFVASTAAPSQARAFVAPLLDRFGAGHLRQEVALVLSELVSNAYQHGVGPIEVAATSTGDAFQLEVGTAPGETEPHLADRGSAEPTGRGLRIVEAVATAWGHDRGPDDQLTVWARFALGGAPVGRSN